MEKGERRRVNGEREKYLLLLISRSPFSVFRFPFSVLRFPKI